MAAGKKAIDIGDFYADSSLIYRTSTGSLARCCATASRGRSSSIERTCTTT